MTSIFSCVRRILLVLSDEMRCGSAFLAPDPFGVRTNKVQSRLEATNITLDKVQEMNVFALLATALIMQPGGKSKAMEDRGQVYNAFVDGCPNDVA